MAVKRFNAIRFVTTDAGTPAASINLKLAGELVLTPGIAPNVHVFEARWPEVEPIQDDPGRMGSIQFFYSADPSDAAAQPDFELKRMRIVDVETVNFGYIKGRAARSPVTVRLHIADRRELLVFPRGGIMDSGEWNKEPFAADRGGVDANGRMPVSMAKLVEMCLEKMRLLEEIDDGTGKGKLEVHNALSDVIPVNNLSWFGAHAPEEMERLLKSAGFVFWVQSDGTFCINQLHRGTPAIPASAVEWPCLGVDRRGKTVVLTSHPFPITDARTLKGPARWYTATADDDLEYVAYDSNNNTWRPVAQTTSDPIDTIRKGIVPAGVNLDSFMTLFRCVRLNPLKYPGKTILRKVLDKSAPPAHIKALAILPVKRSNGLYYNSTAKLALAAKQIIDGQIIAFEHTLGRIQDDQEPVGNQHALFVPLEGDELEVAVSFECTVERDGTQVPEYVEIGFEQALGGVIRRLEDAELKALLAKPGAIIIPRPELRLIRKAGADQNLSNVQNWAAIIAAGILRGSDKTAKEWHVRGFEKVEVGPRVPEIRISQGGPHMIIRTDAWHFPHTHAYASSGARPPKKAPQERFHGETATASLRTYQGNSTATQPSVPVLPSSPPPPLEDRLVLVDLEKVSGDNGTKTTAATWKYKVSRKGTKLLDEAAPAWLRQNGTFAFATQGIAQIAIDGTVTLLVAFEVRGTVGCS